MNRLNAYLDSQVSSQAGFEVSNLGLDKLPNKLAKMDPPFFLMKRKKSVPPPPYKKTRGSHSYETRYQQVSFANLRSAAAVP